MIRLGVIGCGGFGLFALQHFAQLPGVRPVAMAGTHREASIAAARRFGIPDVQEIEALLNRDDVDLVYIATPPFLHYEQSLAGSRARQTRDLRKAAGRHGRTGRHPGRRPPANAACCSPPT